MLDGLIDPLQYEFMRHALVIGVMTGVLCPVVGSYLIVQRMALLGDVIAHCVFPGLAISYFLGTDILVGAFASGSLGAFLIGWIRSQSRVNVDSAMALTFSSFFALGVMLVTLLKSQVDLEHFLFGDILGVTSTDLLRTCAIAVLVLTSVRLFYKELLFYTFDRVGAQAMGLPVRTIHLAFLTAVTLTIIASMQAVGVILVIALLIGPALTAYLLVQELHHVMLLGAGLGAFASVAGVYISNAYNLPSGPAIVLVVSSLFMLALLLSPSQGILVGQWRHHAHRQTQPSHRSSPEAQDSEETSSGANPESTELR